MFGKKAQKVMVAALVVVLSVALLATSVGGIGYLFLNANKGQDFQALVQQDYDQLTSNIEHLEMKVAEDPSNADVQKTLANLYAQRAEYAGYWSFIGIMTDPQADYQKAADGFQAYLEAQAERPTDVLLSLAEVSWKAGFNELSETVFLELLEREPDNTDILINYGHFCWNGLGNRDQAIAQWEKVKSLTEDSKVQEDMNQLIQQVKDQDTENQDQETENQDQNTEDQNTEDPNVSNEE